MFKLMQMDLARLIGRAGFGLCQYDHNGEIACGQTETVPANSVNNAGKNRIFSINRSHANANDESCLRIGRRFEMKSTGLMKGVYSVIIICCI